MIFINLILVMIQIENRFLSQAVGFGSVNLLTTALFGTIWSLSECKNFIQQIIAVVKRLTEPKSTV